MITMVQHIVSNVYTDLNPWRWQRMYHKLNTKLFHFLFVRKTFQCAANIERRVISPAAIWAEHPYGCSQIRHTCLSINIYAGGWSYSQSMCVSVFVFKHAVLFAFVWFWLCFLVGWRLYLGVERVVYIQPPTHMTSTRDTHRGAHIVHVCVC